MTIDLGKAISRRNLATPEYQSLLKVAEEFLYFEADLLDFRLYDAWLGLLTEDIRYFMPIVRNVEYGDWERELTREHLDVGWFDESKLTLIKRVRQIETGVHWAEQPSSRTSHLLTNMRIMEARPNFREPLEVDVSARFFIYRNRLDDEVDHLVGKRLDTLRQVDGEWKLARRMIILDQSVLLSKNLTVFL
jgi:3-phenylpropionate/cinnamic acid dioxygenase small subunit